MGKTLVYKAFMRTDEIKISSLIANNSMQEKVQMTGKKELCKCTAAVCKCEFEKIPILIRTHNQNKLSVRNGG